MARLKHWSVLQGDILNFTVTFKNLETSISGIELAVKKSLDQETYDAYLYENQGITKLVSNKYLITISPEITSELEPAWYFYQLKCKKGGMPVTVLDGKIIVKEPVING